MNCPKCNAINTPEAKFCASCGTPFDAKTGAALTGVKPIKRINPHLFTGVLWGGVVLLVLSFIFIESSKIAGALMMLAGFIMLSAAMIMHYVYLYRAWSIIQGSTARTTAVKAVAYLFVPIFNFYWIFIANKGLATDANAFLDKKSLNHLKINGGLSLAYCITIFIPIVNYIVTPILLTVLVYQWARFVNGILDNPEVVDETTAARVAARFNKGNDSTVIIVVIASFVVIAMIGILAAIAIPAFLGQQAKAKQRAMETDSASMVLALDKIMQQCGDYPTFEPIGPGPSDYQISLEGIGECTSGEATVSILADMTYEVEATEYGYSATLRMKDVKKHLVFDQDNNKEWIND